MEIEQCFFSINSNIPARFMSSKILYQKSSKVKNLALKNNGLRQRKMTQLFLPPLINDQYIMLMEAPQVLLWQHILMDFSSKVQTKMTKFEGERREDKQPLIWVGG
jgi:hypothetical protein